MLLKDIIGDMVDSLKIDEELLGIDIKGVAYDSRDIKPGYVFFARKGENIDSHRFIEDAHKRGAILYVVTRDIDIGYPKIVATDWRRLLAHFATSFYGNPARNMKVIGITGTNGKSTVAILLHSIYQTSGNPCGLIGTIFYKISSSTIPADRTTPESLDIARLMDSMRKNGVETVVMEVSSHGIDQRRIEEIDFDLAGLTCIGRDHLDYHHTFENYLRTKLSFFRGLGRDALAILPGGDYLELFRSNTIARTLSYGFQTEMDYRVEVVSTEIEGMRLILHTPHQREEFSVSLIGRHNAANILLAYAIAREDGLRSAEIIEGIKKVKTIPGRFERIGNVIIDYAHTPDAMEAALKSAREITKGRLIVVFGCGGDRDRGKRPMMGEVATKLADYVIITSDNPRTEDLLKIIDDIRGGISSKNYEIIPQREEAVIKSMGLADKDDTVLVLGKGHETYQIIGEDKIHFDDREIVTENLKER